MFSPEGPRENVSPGPDMALDGPAKSREKLGRGGELRPISIPDLGE